MTYKDKGSYESSPPCTIMNTFLYTSAFHWSYIYEYIFVSIYAYTHLNGVHFYFFTWRTQRNAKSRLNLECWNCRLQNSLAESAFCNIYHIGLFCKKRPMFLGSLLIAATSYLILLQAPFAIYTIYMHLDRDNVCIYVFTKIRYYIFVHYWILFNIYYVFLVSTEMMCVYMCLQ